jgi:hypothetical protein
MTNKTLYDIDVEPVGADLLWGCDAISQEINLPKQKCFYHLEHGNLPAQKVGGVWVASRSRLRARLLGA